MLKGARRLLFRLKKTCARHAVLTLCLWPALAASDTIQSAEYTDPTTRYTHGVLGDAIEHGSLRLTLQDGRKVTITLPQSDVFEDTRPRLADLDGDGAVEVITVQSNARLGAKLAIYNAEGEVAATPNIGTRNRWLAPLGAADLDGDGTQDVAFVDRPHLAKTLRIWRFENATLTQIAELPGYTNHKIGERDIAGGIRHCNGVPEMVLANANWTQLVAITFQQERFDVKTLGRDTSRDSFALAMTCQL
ncbi:VCBS repeat-containing protein [Ascidiaceihabitans sp.]|uniref:FG-GAP repeat domain-containing protein n=1 Tax=Ascidiaceihabitans sp. TaxID=1872644 RepID=UPI003296C9C7